MEFAKKYLGEKLIQQILRYLSKNPEQNLPKLLQITEKVAVLESHKTLIANAKIHLDNPHSNWYKAFLRVANEVNPKVLEKLSISYLINSVFLGVPKQHELAKQYGHSIPYAVLLDPTDRCNLQCIGCWAGDYQKSNDLEFDVLDRIITEGEELGIFFYVVSGGEPLIRKDDLIQLSRKHGDSVFHVFTNSTLINEEFAAQVADAGNITFAISLEGFEQSTDARRGKGVFQKVMDAMDILKRHGIVFGFSTTYTRNNVDEVSSDQYIDMLIEKGCLLGWYFTYVPVGSDCDLELMATPEQRATMFEQVKYFRQTKPIFVADFWNDGEGTNGCIAGGKRYLHINAAGEVEPCAFIHYSNCNIKDVSLLDALGSPIMRAYQKRQPFNTNLLRPCPLIDNPTALRDIVNESGARSTQIHGDGGLEILVQNLSDYATNWGQISDSIWEANHSCSSCGNKCNQPVITKE